MVEAITRDCAGTKQSGPNSSTYERAAELRADGLSYAEIGRRLGVSKQRIFSVLNGHPRSPARPVSVAESKMILTANEVAFLLGVHLNTVRRWADAGALKSFRVGPRGDRRFEKPAVIEFLGGVCPGKAQADRTSCCADKHGHIEALRNGSSSMVPLSGSP